MAKPHILIFARYPEAGAVKTRMSPPLSPEQAADLHLASLRAVWELVHMNTTMAATLVVTPDDRVDALRSKVDASPHECWPQGGGTLGDRLIRAVGRASRESQGPAILLGADSPTLPPEYINRADDLLDTHDAVLGPCADGGYYLLGLRRPCDSLFLGIEWGTERVAQQTRGRAEDAGLKLAELPEWYDLDRYDDLSAAANDLAKFANPARPAACVLQGLLERLSGK